MLYLDAAERRERRQRAEGLGDMSHAFSGGKEAQTLFRDLQKD